MCLSLVLLGLYIERFLYATVDNTSFHSDTYLSSSLSLLASQECTDNRFHASCRGLQLYVLALKLIQIQQEDGEGE